MFSLSLIIFDIIINLKTFFLIQTCYRRQRTFFDVIHIDKNINLNISQIKKNIHKSFVSSHWLQLKFSSIDILFLSPAAFDSFEKLCV